LKPCPHQGSYEGTSTENSEAEDDDDDWDTPVRVLAERRRTSVVDHDGDDDDDSDTPISELFRRHRSKSCPMSPVTTIVLTPVANKKKRPVPAAAPTQYKLKFIVLKINLQYDTMYNIATGREGKNRTDKEQGGRAQHNQIIICSSVLCGTDKSDFKSDLSVCVNKTRFRTRNNRRKPKTQELGSKMDTKARHFLTS
jgi:hypothetical protein